MKSDYAPHTTSSVSGKSLSQILGGLPAISIDRSRGNSLLQCVPSDDSELVLRDGATRIERDGKATSRLNRSSTPSALPVRSIELSSATIVNL